MTTTIRFVLLALLIFLPVRTAFGLDPQRSLHQYVREHWTSDNGLPQNGIYSIKQSFDGYLWFVTEEGIVRFDGAQMKVFDRKNTPALETNTIVNIFPERDGTVWFIPRGDHGFTRLKDGAFTTFGRTAGFTPFHRNRAALDSAGMPWATAYNGVFHFDGTRFIHYTRENGLPSDTTYTIYADHEGGVWIACTGKIAHFQNGTFSYLSPADGLFTDTVNVFREDHEGNVWIGTTHGLNVRNARGIAGYTKKDGLSSDTVNAVFEDSRFRVWVGTERGVDLFDHGKFTHVFRADRTPGGPIAEFYEDAEGTIWIRTIGEGIQRYSHGILESFTKRDGLPEDAVQSIFEDKEGSLWVGLNGGGLVRLRDTKFITIAAEDGLSENLVNGIFEDRDHNLWAATFNNGVNKISGGVITQITTKDGLLSNALGAVTQGHDGAIYIGGDKGLQKFQHGKFTNFNKRDGLSADGIISLYCDSAGTIWIATSEGLDFYRDGAFHHVKNFIGSTAASIFENAAHDLWVATDQGFQRLRSSDGTIVQQIRCGADTIGQGIIGIWQDEDGTLWLGTMDRGLLRYKNGKITSITPKNGLFDFNVFSIQEDEYGNLWMDCNNGIFKASKQELNDFADGKIPSITCTAFGPADGMKVKECNGGYFPSSCRMHDGRLCFPTVHGIAMIDPASIKLNVVPPPVVIEEMSADLKPLDPLRDNVLAPGTEKLEFHFAGISFIGAEKVRYKYKLEPFETEWVNAGGRRDAYYTHIPPGEYHFHVIAENNDGIWNETGATASFILKPHFYESSWFYAICIFGFVGIGPGIYLMRVRQLKSREAALQNVVEARTHELQTEKENVEKALDDLKEAQKQLVLSEKMASLGQLTAGIAHEIKNPLNFVTNFATLSNDLMKELEVEFEKHKEKFESESATNVEELIRDLRQNVSKINEHGKRADSIVRGMLLHSRGRSGERQMTDINALLAEYANLAYHGLRAQDASFNIKIETDFDQSIGSVNVVPQDLSRVFLNIINNGCYSANDKKKHAGNGFAPTIRVSSRNRPDSFQVIIRDNGNGIPKNILDKIYNPFFTTKPAGAGTGLGLSLSYDIITQEHKGTVEVKTAEGEFAEFIITIPKE